MVFISAYHQHPAPIAISQTMTGNTMALRPALSGPTMGQTYPVHYTSGQQRLLHSSFIDYVPYKNKPLTRLIKYQIYLSTLIDTLHNISDLVIHVFFMFDKC